MSFNNEPGTFPYIIQANDTIEDIAEKYATNVEDIMEINSDVDPYNLYIGQVIGVPGDPPSTYAEVDPLQFPRERRPFERRPRFRPAPFRPFFRPPCPRGRLYTVQPGDTIYRISARLRIPIRELIASNRHINFNFPLQVGEVLCIPFR